MMRLMRWSSLSDAVSPTRDPSQSSAAVNGGCAGSYVVGSHPPIAEGPHLVGFDFTRTGDFAGIGRLFVDRELVGEGDLPFTTPARFTIAGSGLTCGYETGPAISGDYTAPFRFTHDIRRATVDVTGTAYRDLAAELSAVLSEQ